ncbi:unnamed protein product, partial [marine sediment metagenome]
MAPRMGITTAQAQQLRDSGWSIQQIQQHYTIGGALNGVMAPPGALNGAPVITEIYSIPQTPPSGAPYMPGVERISQNGGSAPMISGIRPQLIAAGIPAALLGILPAAAITALGAA